MKDRGCDYFRPCWIGGIRPSGRTVHLFAALALIAARGDAAETDAAGIPSRNYDASVAPPSADCSVDLWALSYDDPGVDDGEFLELRLQVVSGTPETWADCGVRSLELLNGATPACSPYRTLLLADLPVRKAEERVRFCAATNPSAACQPNAARNAGLKNGWLQNGPDALRVLDRDARVLKSYSYDGAIHCGAIVLPSESGEFKDAMGKTSDDVILWCEGETYVLAPFDEQEQARQSKRCEVAIATEAAHPGALKEPIPPPLDGAVSAQPGPRPGRILDGGIRRVRAPTFFDAGKAAIAIAPSEAKPELPSLACQVAGPASTQSTTKGGLFALALWVIAYWRRSRAGTSAAGALFGV